MVEPLNGELFTYSYCWFPIEGVLAYKRHLLLVLYIFSDYIDNKCFIRLETTLRWSDKYLLDCEI